MSKIDEVRSAMVAAMKAKDKTTKDAVSSLVSAVKKAAIDEGCREDVPEALVDRVILKEMKTEALLLQEKGLIPDRESFSMRMLQEKKLQVSCLHR